MILKMLRSVRKQMHIQILMSIALAFFLPAIVRVQFVEIFFAVSTFLVDMLLFLLPIVVFTFIAVALVHIETKNLWVVGLVFACVLASNIVAVLAACGYAFGLFEIFDLRPCAGFHQSPVAPIDPAFRIVFPSWLSTRSALLLGLLFGAGMHLLQRRPDIQNFFHRGLEGLNKAVVFFLKSIFVPLIPVYVFGFCLKLSYEGALTHLFSSYGCVFLAAFAFVIFYVLFLYALGGGVFRIIPSLKNMLPAGLMGFSTMSGAAAMPVAIEGAIKNTHDAPLCKLVIPTSSNVHMVGDNIIITITALSLLLISGAPFPDPYALVLYACAYAVAKLSCVGVPGASVLVVLPVLEQHFGFTPSMIGVLTTIYILQDSLGTASNVMANGAFAMIVKRIFARFQKLRALEN